MNLVVSRRRCGAPARRTAVHCIGSAARLTAALALGFCAMMLAGEPATSLAGEPPAASPDDHAYFEETIQPLLVANCYDCHSHESGEASGGLVLDSRAGWAVGGDSGPALVPGKPEESLLVRAVAYDEADLQMPPDGKMDDAAIAALTDWVRRGAFDPRTTGEGAPSGAKPASIDVEAGRSFWSYQPIADPAAPDVRDAAWPAGDLDRFVLARLEREGFAPAAEADRATLIRRLYLDLTGIPPTPEEIDAFVRDDSPDAWERLVDRLLASPAFGERFARRWLDVVRYGESMTLRGLVFHEAWRFRDYVIRSYDEDRPWNRVLAEHVAGDLLPAEALEEQRRGQIATTFLVMGNKNLEEQDKKALDLDAVDEQLDSLGKAFLGQTIGCARCHDHKFDPIPTRDYYAMAGILLNTQTLVHSNVSGWTENPLPLPAEEEARYSAHEAQASVLQAQIDDAKKKVAELTKGARPADGMVSPGSLAGVVVDDAEAKQVGYWKESTYAKPFVGAGYLHDENVGKGEKTLTFTAKLPKPGRYEVRLAYSSEINRATNVPATVFSADGEKTVMIDQRRVPPIDGLFVALGTYRFEKDGQSFVLVSNEATDGHVIVDAVQFLPVEEGADAVADAAANADAAAAEQLAEQQVVAAKESLKQLQDELKAHQARLPERPTAMSVRELPSDRIGNTRIRVRGMPHNLGDEVPRGFLQVATAGPMPTFPETQSGRKELGEWLASEANPLPARVYANRVWLWLIGEGLVATPDNFGASGEMPSHPELLDWLASRLRESDWSTKELVREIVLSKTYRMSSATDPAGETADPENRLVRRANAKRTDAETLRDSMLFVAGRLERERFGNQIPSNVSADYDFVAKGDRRTIYLPALRNATPEIAKIFDGADPSAVTGRRPESASAAQALFLLNDEFVAGAARSAAERLLAEDAASFEERLERLYRRTLGRAPYDGERAAAESLFGVGTDDESSRAGDLERWTTFCRALFASADFRRTY